jgi:hypothetical protein
MAPIQGEKRGLPLVRQSRKRMRMEVSDMQILKCRLDWPGMVYRSIASNLPFEMFY